MNPTRESLLRAAFCNIPCKLGNLTLRNLSAASYTLLGEIKNPLVTGAFTEAQSMFASVIEYAWIHSAPLDEVAAIVTREELPAKQIKMLGFEIPMDEAMNLLKHFLQASQRMAASLAEIVEDEDTPPGKPETAPVGLRLLSSHLAEPPIQIESDTFSGSCPSSEPSPTSTPPTPPLEPPVGGFMLPSVELSETTKQP